MIGVYGGTFDPIHYGHLRPGLEVFEALSLQELRFVPSGEPPHREKPQASPQQRLMMVRAAIADQPGFVLDDREQRREGPSYMVETLSSLRQDLDESPLCLLLGLDAFLGLESWYRWESLFEYAHIVVTHRPGWSLRDMNRESRLARLVHERETRATGLARYPAGRVCFQAVSQLDISSSGIRGLLEQGKNIRYLVPDAVYEIIKTQHIYG